MINGGNTEAAASLIPDPTTVIVDIDNAWSSVSYEESVDVILLLANRYYDIDLGGAELY